jgi:hypothetical protein
LTMPNKFDKKVRDHSFQINTQLVSPFRRKQKFPGSFRLFVRYDCFCSS